MIDDSGWKLKRTKASGNLDSLKIVPCAYAEALAQALGTKGR
jgi:hypothetical protein